MLPLASEPATRDTIAWPFSWRPGLSPFSGSAFYTEGTLHSGTHDICGHWALSLFHMVRRVLVYDSISKDEVIWDQLVIFVSLLIFL